MWGWSVHTTDSLSNTQTHSFSSALKNSEFDSSALNVLSLEAAHFKAALSFQNPYIILKSIDLMDT